MRRRPTFGDVHLDHQRLLILRIIRSFGPAHTPTRTPTTTLRQAQLVGHRIEPDPYRVRRDWRRRVGGVSDPRKVLVCGVIPTNWWVVRWCGGATVLVLVC